MRDASTLAGGGMEVSIEVGVRVKDRFAENSPVNEIEPWREEDEPGSRGG